MKYESADIIRAKVEELVANVDDVKKREKEIRAIVKKLPEYNRTASIEALASTLEGLVNGHVRELKQLFAADIDYREAVDIQEEMEALIGSLIVAAIMEGLELGIQACKAGGRPPVKQKDLDDIVKDGLDVNGIMERFKVKETRAYELQKLAYGSGK